MSVSVETKFSGQPAVRVQHDEWRKRVAKVAGSHVGIIMDEAVPGADVYAIVNVLAPEGVIPLHWHSIGELQFILSGTGVFMDAHGNEQPVGPHDSVWSPAGPAGAHGFRCDGPLPLAIQCVYPSSGGYAPDMHFVDPGDPVIAQR